MGHLQSFNDTLLRDKCQRNFHGPDLNHGEEVDDGGREAASQSKELSFCFKKVLEQKVVEEELALELWEHDPYSNADFNHGYRWQKEPKECPHPLRLVKYYDHHPTQ